MPHRRSAGARTNALEAAFPPREKQRWLNARLVSAPTALVFLILGFAVPALADPLDLKLAAQPLSAALREFARQTGIQVAIQSELTDGKMSPSLNGKYEPDVALAALLQGTGLTAYPVYKNTYGIREGGSAPAKHDKLHATSFDSNNELPGAAATSSSDPPQTPPPADNAQSSQSATAQSDDRSELQEVVVTGTLVRGVAPVGTKLLEVSSEDIRASGIANTAEIMEQIPQFNSFNTVQFPVPSGTVLTANRPNLRNLPGFDLAGGSTTLVLMDGHRIVGMGIQSTTPDPDFVPPGAIERLEIVPDGGSAIYGSDAVAGVMNFITRKSVEGVELNVRKGFAADYDAFDVNASAGHSWGTGSAYVTYSYAQHDALYGRDRSYAKLQPTLIGGVPITSLTCSPGNVQSLTTGTIYALPFTAATAVPNTANQCNIGGITGPGGDNLVLSPEQQLHSVLAGVSQDINAATRIDIRGYYMNREINSTQGPFTATEITGGVPLPFATFSPFYASHALPGPLPAQSVSFIWGGPDSTVQPVQTQSWGIASTLTRDIGSSWQLRVLGNYGWSDTVVHRSEFNPGALTNSIGAGLFNPYDPASSNPAGLGAIANYETYGRAPQKLYNARAIADGNLLTLPGGPAKLAVGLEFIREELESQKGDIVPGTQDSGFSGLSIGSDAIIPASTALPVYKLHRSTKAEFAELAIPIVGSANARKGIDELTLSIAGRYDDYSDFGSTFNPKLGLTFKPLNWINVRGSWGTSFNAPSLADVSQANPTNAIGVPATFYQIPVSLQMPNGPLPVPATGQQIIILGGATALGPQKANTLSLGFDVDPPFIPGLEIGLTYWKIKLIDGIGYPSFFLPNQSFQSYARYITLSPTPAQVMAATSGAILSGSAPCLAPSLPAPGNPACVYAILNSAKTNLGALYLDGLDFSPRYVRKTLFGSFDIGVSGTYELTRERALFPGAPYTINDLDANTSRFRLSATAGVNIGHLRSQATLWHSAGYDVSPAVGIAPNLQTHIGAFDVVNLYFRYDFAGDNLLKNLALTLNVDNVADTSPPFLAQGNGFGNGATLGRLVSFGLSKKL